MNINLISDTVTKPSKGMLEAMFSAKVGDDVFNEDPTVNYLQEKAAALFGMEKALFFPSGTMANQAAIKVQTQPGDRMFCHNYAHVYNYEGGGAAFLSGITTKLLDGPRGMFSAETLKEQVAGREDIHIPIQKLVAIENTTNKGGGACWDLSEIQKIKQICHDHSLKLHLDGARLFNAIVAKGQVPEDFGASFDSISICLSKGLGCPIGSILLGDEETISKAHRLRKMLGGGMRQVGYIAAAGIYALDTNIKRLSEDHQRAKIIAEALLKRDSVSNVEAVETNIIIFSAASPLAEQNILSNFNKNNIKISSMGANKLRIVTHLDFTDEMLKVVLKVIKDM